MSSAICFNLKQSKILSSCNKLKSMSSLLLRMMQECWSIRDYCTGIYYLPFPKRQILDSPKLREFADDNFKFDKNGRKFSK